MRARLITGVLVVCALSSGLAQNVPSTVRTPTQPPTAHGDSTYVRVDMYATLRGQPVDDLTAADVEVLEDGAPQAVADFEHVSVRPAPGEQDTRIEPNTVAGNRPPTAPPRARVFVVFLDTNSTQLDGSSRMRLPVVRFLDTLLGPDDLVALMTPGMSPADITLGRKATVISNIMQVDGTGGRQSRGQTNNDSKEKLYESCYPDTGDTAGVAVEMKNRRREMLTFDALSDLVAHLDGLRPERKAVITVTEGWLLAGPQTLGQAKTRQGGTSLPFGLKRRERDRGQRSNVSTTSMTECETDRNVFSALDNRQRLHDITERANRSNVTFYPVDPRGLATSDTTAPADERARIGKDAASLSTRQDSLRQLALETDGYPVISTNDVERGEQRIVDDLSSYYLLGYYTTNMKLDGRFRTITVRVRRPGVQARTRRGYRGPTAADLTGGPSSAPTASRNVASAFNAVAVVPSTSFRLRTATWPRAEATAVTGAVWVTGELDYKLRRDVNWTAGAMADVILVSTSGTEVLSKTIDVDAAEGTFTLRIPEGGGLMPGEYALRINLRSRQEGTPGLSGTARVIVPPAAAPIGEGVLWRRGPSTGPRFLMTADPRFQRSERVRLEHATAAMGAPGARLIDQQGKTLAVPVAVTTRPDDSGEFRWVVAELALAPLAPGSYGIEVAVGEAKVVTAFTVVP